MPRIQLGTAQEKELTAFVLEKLNEFGWADNDVLANFIVVMVANDKSKEDITEELNDIMPGQAPAFADWLFDQFIDMESAPPMDQVQADDTQYAQEPMESTFSEAAAPPTETTTTTSSSRQRSPDRRAPGRLLQSAISSATRAEPRAPNSRQIPSRVYEDERRGRRSSREKSTSPIRSREGILTSRSHEERIRFRRSSTERRAQDHETSPVTSSSSRIGSRLGNSGADRDRFRGRLGGRIEDRLGKREDDSHPRRRSRERSWDRGSNDYHDRRDNRRDQRSPESRKRDALRDIDRRLGTHPVAFVDEDEMVSVPRQPAAWLRGQQEGGNPVRCKFWPNCAQKDMCQYWHPKELCAEYPNCPNSADTCLYVHPLAEPTAEQIAAARRQALQSMRKSKGDAGAGGANGGAADNGNAMQMPFALGAKELEECRFGESCSRPDCKFLHPERKQAACRFYPNCTKANCPFYHPSTAYAAPQDSAMDESGAPSRLPTVCRFGDE
ncbi:hypothetical protein BG011_001682, partial [Mortierella polycephala]